MKRHIFFISLFAFLSAQVGFAQSQRQKANWDEALFFLNKTDFCDKYKEYKAKMEKDVTSFLSNKDNLKVSKENLDAVQKAYQKSAEKFDLVFDKMKGDFANAGKRKQISKAPEDFAKAYKADLLEAYNFYVENCQQKMDALAPTTGTFTAIPGLNSWTSTRMA